MKPNSLVLDVGLISNRSWVVILANAAWGTGMIFDLRNLSKINRIEYFLALCKYLEDREALD